MLARRAATALALAVLAAGCGGDSECGGGARSSLSVWGEKGGKLGATFRLTGAHPGDTWRLVVVHESHVRWRGRMTVGPDGALQLYRRMGDYRGIDHLSVRAYGPNGATCSAAADLSAT